MAKRHRNAQVDKNRLHYSESIDDSPLPSAEELKKYVELDPDFMPYIKEMAKREQEFRHETVERRDKIAKREQGLYYFYSSFSFSGCLILAASFGYISYLLIMADRLIEGSLMAGGTLLTIVLAFLKKVPNQNKPKA